MEEGLDFGVVQDLGEIGVAEESGEIPVFGQAVQGRVIDENGAGNGLAGFGIPSFKSIPKYLPQGSCIRTKRRLYPLR